MSVIAFFAHEFEEKVVVQRVKPFHIGSIASQQRLMQATVFPWRCKTSLYSSHRILEKIAALA